MTFDDARFVKMEVVEDTSTIECNAALIHKDHALLPECSLQQHMCWSFRFALILLLLCTWSKCFIRLETLVLLQSRGISRCGSIVEGVTGSTFLGIAEDSQ